MLVCLVSVVSVHGAWNSPAERLWQNIHHLALCCRTLGRDSRWTRRGATGDRCYVNSIVLPAQADFDRRCSVALPNNSTASVCLERLRCLMLKTKVSRNCFNKHKLLLFHIYLLHTSVLEYIAAAGVQHRYEYRSSSGYWHRRTPC
jgi:hypothetical protein